MYTNQISYVIGVVYNTFNVRFTGTNVLDYVVVVPTGSYTNQTLASAIKLALSTCITDVYVDFEWSSTNQYYTFSCQYQFSIDLAASNIASLINMGQGFYSSISIGGQNVVNGNLLTYNIIDGNNRFHISYNDPNGQNNMYIVIPPQIYTSNQLAYMI